MNQEFSAHHPLADGPADLLERFPNPWEEVAEVGPSVSDVPAEPPPTRAVLLDSVPTPEHERKRGGSLGPVMSDSPGNTATSSAAESGTSLALPSPLSRRTSFSL